MRPPAITPEQYLGHIRQRCEDEFKFFARYFFKYRKGSKFVFSDHHHVICDALAAVHRGEITNLIVNIPPRYSKTELCVVLFSAWCYVKNPRCEFIHLSYADALVAENSEAIRDILKSFEFRQLWPSLSISPSKDARKAWETNEGGKFYATATGGQVTGFGAGRLDEVDPKTAVFRFSGCMLIDDPLKPEDARSDTMRKAINGRWDTTLKSRLNGPRTPVILIMQRIHEDDFAGMLMQDKERKWHHLNLPALLNEGTPHERALWPAKHTVAQLHAMKARNAYMFSAQMQGKPSPMGGGTFKGEWFGRYKVAPRILYRIMVGDTAQKTAERHDYSVFSVWGAGEDKRVYLLDLIRGKWEAPELEKRVLAFWAKHKYAGEQGALRQLLIEDKASGTGLIQSLAKGGVGRTGGMIPVKPVQRMKDKYTRYSDVAPYVEAGWVVVPEEAPFTADFIAEAESITADDTHAHDDQIDTMADAIDTIAGTQSALRDWMEAYETS